MGQSDPVKDKVKISRQQSYRSAVRIIGNLRRLFFPIPQELHAPDSLFFTDPNQVYQWVLRNDPTYSFYTSERTEINKSRLLFAQSILEYGIPAMTDEEAFLFAASIYSDFANQKYKYNPNETFEHLLVPGEDDSNMLQSVCAFVRKQDGENLYLEALQSKVNNYCKSTSAE